MSERKSKKQVPRKVKRLALAIPVQKKQTMETVDTQNTLRAVSALLAPRTETKKDGWFLVDEKKESKEKMVPLSLLKDVFSSLKLPMFRTRLGISGQLAVNSGAGSYIVQWILPAGTNNYMQFLQLNQCSEFSSLDALFDQVFIHSMRITYKPRNHFSAQSTASSSASGSPGDVNTIGGVIVFLPANSPAYSSASGVCGLMLSAQNRKIIDLGSPFVFNARNTTKFDPRGDIGDQSTNTATQGWCLFSLVSTKYGGLCELCTTASSGASAGIGTLLEGGIFGDIFVEWDISCRARF